MLAMANKNRRFVIMKAKKAAVILLCTVLVSIAGAVPVSALDAGAYTAPCKTYYLNPDTGVTDDGGTKDRDIGEGMCRSAIYESSLIESDGAKTYLTIRMQLMSNIRNIRFFVQDEAGNPDSYRSVSFDTMQEDASADTADMCFEVPRADAYIRCIMYVIPMGRDVTYYIRSDADQAKAGSGDFVTSIESEPENTPPAPQVSGSPADKFTDLSGHWAKNAAAAVVSRGLFTGTGETTFSPDDPMTRGMFVTVAGRFSNVNKADYPVSAFSDAPVGTWYGPYVAWAAANKIVNGTGDGMFSPDLSITQQEIAVMLVRYCDFRGLTLPQGRGAPLVNRTQAASWASDAVSKLADAGFITDTDGGVFMPAKAATRVQVASILARFLDYYGI